MVILGLLLILLGALVGVVGLFLNEGTGELLGRFDIGSVGVFLMGAVAGALVLWGISILKWGTKRGLARRRESKELNRLSEKLDRVEAERREDGDSTPSS